MIWSVSNPTSRHKAVRANGGLVTIKAGETVELEAFWTELELERYWVAGLVIEPAPAPEVETVDVSTLSDPDPVTVPAAKPKSGRKSAG